MMTKFSFLTSAVFTFIVGLASTPLAQAQVNAEFSAVPPESRVSDPPLVMLTMSRDHQYFFKAYNDYTDLDPENEEDLKANDGNPIIETTYKHSFNYFGYFDHGKCYDYSSGGGGVFVPKAISNADNYCNGVAGSWSGNFLNWVSMTRMDVMRSIFYGGRRSTDSADKTVLERAHLPLDAHSFAKYYNGPDIARLTPFNPTSDAVNGDNDGFDDINEGITFCNTTFNNTNGASQQSTQPPLIRVVEGNYQLWNSNERWQCTYDDERLGGNKKDQPAKNGNIPPSSPRTFNIDGVDIEIDSGIDAHTSDPARGQDFTVRVEACKSEDLIGNERCKQYPSGNLKPIGLLQTYGDNDAIRFGLMTGSYQNNIRGGVLRKNIAKFDTEVNVNTDGTFKFDGAEGSIIETLDSLRIYGYRYNDGTYRGNNTQFDDCSFQLNEITNGRCNSWGNPISEIYRETVRYLAGQTPDNNFLSPNDGNFIAGLESVDWNNPLTDENQCADLSTILINASVSSYDDDETGIAGVVGGINGSPVNANNNTTDTWTDMVGKLEGLDDSVGGVAQKFFIGRNGTDNNELCSAKTIGKLSDVLGLCPEAPTVNGSFAMAGLAYYAHNNDLRSDLDGNQTVNTYAISLATNVPTIRVPVSDTNTVVEILPAYRNLNTPSDPGGGALVDFKIVQPHTKVSDGIFSGRFYVVWEDSEQGGDYDQDMWGLIEYVLNETTDQITITTTAVAKSTPSAQLFGFVTNGTTADGFHAYSGINGANFTDSVTGGCSNCRALSEGGGGQRGKRSHTFRLSTTAAAANLESPLFYAAKYGGFDENLGETTNALGETVSEVVSLDDAPDEVDEWDRVNNNTGEDGADGLPDDFFFVINPENLFNSLESSLNQILSQERAASSAVASFANSNGFGNIIIQGTYQELLRDPAVAEVEWTGEIFSYFIDDFGLFREDNQTGGTQGTLDDYVIDRAFRYDVSGPEPRIQFLSIPLDVDGNVELNAEGRPEPVNDGTPVDLQDLDPLWSGGDRLRSIDNDSAKEQRLYTNRFPDPGSSAASRHIFTYIDRNLNGEVDGGEQIDFTEDDIDASNFGFFGVATEASADSIVNYIRGFDDPATTNFRNRTVSLDGTTEEVYRLGDLVNSTPLVIGSPNAGYDTRFGDEGYAAFREKYENRRQVAYVGANDGLLHAFNIGFRDPSIRTVKYERSPNSETNHPLGAEIWAYAPFNLLPHLQWLTSRTYNHVFYVDGSPKSFDVKLPSVFADQSIYPGNWGTILVVGMRLGGGDFPVTNGSDSTTLRSAYVVLDVTDPEREPRILAEVTHADLNLTTSEPDLFYDCDGTLCSDNNDQNNFDGDWKLVFGSGPNDIKTFSSSENAKVFAYDLDAKTLQVTNVENPSGSLVLNSFVGNVAVRDWDNGLLGFRNDDAAYFGTVGSRLNDITPEPDDRIETGAVFRYLPGLPSGATSVKRLIEVDRPVVQAPVLTNGDSFGNNVLSSWVFFATGIYLNADDEEISEQESVYGVIEPVDRSTIDALNVATFDPDRENSELLTYAPVRIGELVDVSDVQVLNNDDGSLGPDVSTGDLRAPVSDAGGATTAGQLEQYIFNNSQGWFKELPLGITAGDPSTRIVDRIVPIRDQIFLTAFTPDTDNRIDICIGGEGISRLFVLNQGAGIPSAFATLGSDGTSGVINDSVIVGEGAASAPILFTSEALGSNDGTIVIQREDGSLTPTLDGEDDFGDRPIGDTETLRSGWREILQ